MPTIGIGAGRHCDGQVLVWHDLLGFEARGSPAAEVRARVRCGPTGCGKSTTLYTTLELIKSPESKIYTVEDPIERRLEGVMQSEVKSAIGLDFAGILRTLLRSDPDIIMVGEIRDIETARMAAEAAITGHLVLSTLHTRDAASAVHRLVEMGVPPYLVSAAFTCVVSQRLVRRLCPHCRKSKTVRASTWEKLGLGEAPRRQLKVYEAAGCTRCFGTGYLGRVGLFEVLALDEEMGDMIEQGLPVRELREAARAQGSRVGARRRRAQGPRRSDQHRRARAGDRVTAPAQVLRRREWSGCTCSDHPAGRRTAGRPRTR